MTSVHTQPNCPFCRSNGLLKSKIIAQTPGAYLTEAAANPGCYLIIPEAHTTTFDDLPDTWWKELKTLLRQVPHLPGHYNISVNYGAHAGQTVSHVHFWIVPRSEGLPSSGKGLVRLLTEFDT